MEDSNTFKITMLGTTQSGKTCYMHGMYAYMQTGIHGFTLSAKDADLDVRLSDNWRRLMLEKGEKRWPPPTTASKEAVMDYAFYMNYGFRPIMEFQWIDYRGGALSDNDPEAKDVQRLRQHIKESSCLFLCLSGEHLTSKANMTTAVKTEANRMNHYLSEVYRTQGTIPIAIIITKFDLCAERDTEEIIEDIKNLFQALFTSDSGWTVMICPVTLGTELAKDINNGNIEPEFVHKPVAFAIYCKLAELVQSEIEYAEERQIRQNELIQDLESLDNWLTKILRSGDIETIEGELSQLEYENELTNQKLEKLKSDMIRLAKEVPEKYVYRNGKVAQIFTD